MNISLHQKQLNIIYAVAILSCFLPFITPPIALAMGILLSIIGLKNSKASKYTSLSLQTSIVLMGFGMSLTQVISSSRTGFIDTAISVILVMSVGLLLTKLFKLDSKTGTLISAGTAICGGSAIAAVASIINPKNSQTSFALVVVFILNAIALIIFPSIGHYFKLSQETFGTWAAIAIHDTSSVVGAGAMYGPKALEVATTVKLIRALWIIPLSIAIAMFQKDKSNGKIKIPWFIGLFVISIIIAYLIPSGEFLFTKLNWLGKRGMVIALFLVGSNFSMAEIKNAGFKSFAMGILLWLFIGVGSFLALTWNA
ncbi:MAG: putative sulfate exporter family transporter [Bacteroidales bacterium]|nr:putative sulfate exporter family transporter [Bacteroidales bacterium]MDY0215683.1 putative sulfate exporter family transporter [Bacteroidales bacterium]